MRVPSQWWQDYEEKCEALGLQTVKERRLQKDLMMAHRSMERGGGRLRREKTCYIYMYIYIYINRSTRKSGTRQAANGSSLMVQYARTDTSCVENRKLKDKIKGKCTGVNKVEKCGKSENRMSSTCILRRT